jgi:hypothetical protein
LSHPAFPRAKKRPSASKKKKKKKNRENGIVMATESTLHVNRQDPQSNMAESPVAVNGGTPKRKAEQGGGTQTRAKRNRYISIAWYVRGLQSILLQRPAVVFLFR